MVTSSITAKTFLRGYLSFLRDAGWDVTLITSQGNGVDAFARDEGVNLCTIPMRRDPSPRHDLVSLFRIALVLRRVDPDVLVYATPKASLLGAAAGRFARVRTRVYEHWGLRLETASGFSYRLLSALEKFTAHLSTHIVANSPSLASRIQELDLNAGKVVHVLGEGSSHGVDVEHFGANATWSQLDVETRSFLQFAPTALTVGFIGRMHPDKGIDTLLEALQICAANHVPVRALLVGSEEGALLDAHLAALDGRVGVHLVGATSDIRPYVQAMDVLVLMSKREGFPNVVLEAASMETPAIVADSTGTIDSVIDGVTGMVVKTGDAVALAKVLKELEQDRAIISAMGARARSRVRSTFPQPVVWGLHSDYFRLARAETARGALGD